LNALNFNNEYREFLNDVKDNLIAQLKSQGRDATGYAANSLRVVSNQKLEAELRGPKYLQYLQTGVGAKPKSIGTKFINNLMRWITAKPSVQPNPKQTIKQLAFAIGKSIVKNGTKIYQGKQKGISISQAIKESRTKLIKEMGQKMRIDFTNGLKVKRR
jgi:hypothetical protein